MSRLHYDLVADRKVADVEIETFTRLLKEDFYGNEEVRMDKPQIWDNTFEYIGVALTGSNIADNVWSILRISWIANRRTRMQFQENISWDNRTQGWAQ